MSKWRHDRDKVSRLHLISVPKQFQENSLITAFRLGSCGCLTDLSVGSIVIPKASVAVTRNYDYDFISGSSQESPYRISKPVRLSTLNENPKIYLIFEGIC